MYEFPADPVIQNIVNRIPRDVLKTFTPEQMQAVGDAMRKSLEGRHIIDYRTTFRWMFKRYYLVLLVGKDRRKQVRQDMAKRRAWWSGIFTAVALLLLALGMATFAISATMLFVYAVKSAFGIDLLPEEHLQDILRGVSKFFISKS